MLFVNGKNHKLLAYVALSFGILSIGFSALLIRWANAPGVISSFYRMAIGALIMVIPFAGNFKKRNGLLSRTGVRLAVVGGFFFSLDLFFGPLELLWVGLPSQLYLRTLLHFGWV